MLMLPSGVIHAYATESESKLSCCISTVLNRIKFHCQGPGKTLKLIQNYTSIKEESRRNGDLRKISFKSLIKEIHKLVKIEEKESKK